MRLECVFYDVTDLDQLVLWPYASDRERPAGAGQTGGGGGDSA